MLEEPDQAKSRWPPPVDARIRALIADGLSYNEVMLALNFEFHSDYSRNAVIGRSHRIGVHTSVKNRSIKNKKDEHVMGRAWSDQLDARMGQLLSERLTYAETAAMLNREFSTDYTRSAVIGRARRVGITVQEDEVKTTKMPVRRQFKFHATRVFDEDLDYNRTAEAVAQPKGRTCCWPSDLPCLEVVTVGAYCLVHAKLAYRVMPSKTRNAVF